MRYAIVIEKSPANFAMFLIYLGGWQPGMKLKHSYEKLLHSISKRYRLMGNPSRLQIARLNRWRFRSSLS